MTEKKNPKLFVLDTNVLLHDPNCIFKFEENIVVIPVETLVELDRKKTAQGELGRSARQIHRVLRGFFEDKPLLHSNQGTKSSFLECPLPEQGILRIFINDGYVLRQPECEPLRERIRASIIHIDDPDHRIMASALYIKEFTPDSEVVFVTKDNNMAVKAMSLGLKVQDFLNDKITTKELREYRKVEIPYDEYTALFDTFNNVDHSVEELPDTSFKLDMEFFKDAELQINEYVIFTSEEQQLPARYVGEGYFKDLPIYTEFNSVQGGTRHGIQLPKGNRVIPKNFEQWILMDAILNPDIKLVTCRGMAGTGKTFLTIATALSLVLSENSHFEKLYISRPVVEIGKDLGALPGELEAKLAPYMQPYIDNLEVLFSQRRNKAGEGKKGSKKPIFTGGKDGGASQPNKPYQWLFDGGFLELEAMTFIRGRSIANAIMVIDEAQNMTPHEAKTVVTRMADDSKLILIGDTQQIDTPFLDAQSNGLVHTRERMKSLSLAAHTKLFEGVRSELSEAAALLM